MQEQNYKNHSRLVPLFHYVLCPAVLVIIIASSIKFVKSYQTGLSGLLVPAILILIGIALGILTWYCRTFALKAQDRAIRAEENLRYFAITGNLLDSKLRMSQIIALRFASNNEFVDLAHKAVAENLSAKEIKEQVQHWKADNNRV